MDLVAFMRELGQGMQQAYERIRKRSLEDPGTAGDQGESDWARLLREWLPAGYHVRTKGRILSTSGDASPQIDVLVLKPSYPPALLNQTYCVASGVAAAFECKVTLRPNDLTKAMTNAKKLTDVLRPEKAEARNHAKMTGVVGAKLGFLEMNRTVPYGLLAHSFDFGARQDETKDVVKIENHLYELDHRLYDSPDQPLDVICIADLATWHTTKALYSLLVGEGKPPIVTAAHGPMSNYSRQHKSNWYEKSLHYASVTPIGALITSVYVMLSRADPSLLGIAKYFKETNKAIVSSGPNWRVWPDCLSAEAKAEYDITKARDWGKAFYDEYP